MSDTEIEIEITNDEALEMIESLMHINGLGLTEKQIDEIRYIISGWRLSRDINITVY